MAAFEDLTIPEYGNDSVQNGPLGSLAVKMVSRDVGAWESDNAYSAALSL
jgi:hypothetical protein